MHPPLGAGHVVTLTHCRWRVGLGRRDTSALVSLASHCIPSRAPLRGPRTPTRVGLGPFLAKPTPGRPSPHQAQLCQPLGPTCSWLTLLSRCQSPGRPMLQGPRHTAACGPSEPSTATSPVPQPSSVLPWALHAGSAGPCRRWPSCTVEKLRRKRQAGGGWFGCTVCL